MRNLATEFEKNLTELDLIMKKLQFDFFDIYSDLGFIPIVDKKYMYNICKKLYDNKKGLIIYSSEFLNKYKKNISMLDLKKSNKYGMISAEFKNVYIFILYLLYITNNFIREFYTYDLFEDLEKYLHFNIQNLFLSIVYYKIDSLLVDIEISPFRQTYFPHFHFLQSRRLTRIVINPKMASKVAELNKKYEILSQKARNSKLKSDIEIAEKSEEQLRVLKLQAQVIQFCEPVINLWTHDICIKRSIENNLIKDIIQPITTKEGREIFIEIYDSLTISTKFFGIVDKINCCKYPWEIKQIDY